MDKVNKLGTAMSKKLTSKKILSKKNSSGGDTLEQAVRIATAKELKSPDTILNQKVRFHRGQAILGGKQSRGYENVSVLSPNLSNLKSSEMFWPISRAKH